MDDERSTTKKYTKKQGCIYILTVHHFSDQPNNHHRYRSPAPQYNNKFVFPSTKNRPQLSHRTYHVINDTSTQKTDARKIQHKNNININTSCAGVEQRFVRAFPVGDGIISRSYIYPNKTSRHWRGGGVSS